MLPWPTIAQHRAWLPAETERLMRFGLLGAALCALASAWAPGFALLVLARALLGACIAGVPAAAMAHLGEELPGNVRARVMGLYIAANALGAWPAACSRPW